jgi:GTPase SAR1 family protein
MKRWEEEARRREEEANRAAEQMRRNLEETRRRDEELRQREEEARRREDLARQLAEENKRAEQEAQQREAEAQAREAESKRQEEEARKAVIKAQEEEELAKKNLAQTNAWLSIGIQPVVRPTEEEFNLAQARIEYNSKKVHLAICGSSGAGKSSLINAFRGFANHDVEAAPAGVVETTTDINRYPDARAEFPHSHFVWFDVPGAGTLNIPGWQYFNQQGLFIFDVVVLVYDTVSLDTRSWTVSELINTCSDSQKSTWLLSRTVNDTESLCMLYVPRLIRTSGISWRTFNPTPSPSRTKGMRKKKFTHKLDRNTLIPPGKILKGIFRKPN